MSITRYRASVAEVTATAYNAAHPDGEYVTWKDYDALRTALDDLCSVQNGCPLPKYQDDWDAAMLTAGRLLGYRIPATTEDTT